jgi:hypothetical protein
MSRALIIACQYKKFPKSQLFGCFNDAEAFIARLKKIDPFIKITYMRDDLHERNLLFPNVQNITRELLNLTRCSETKLYFHYSGHGTQTKDSNNDEKTILTTTNGNQISILNGVNGDSCMVCYSGRNLVLLRDDDFYFYLSRLRPEQTLIAFSDSCNSGTLFDLCYVNVGNYTSEFSTYDISGLLLEINTKCTIVNSFYPDKVNKTKANILLISGTRDKDSAYEVYADRKPCGIFTYNLCKILDYGVKDMSLRTFYYLLMSSINWNQQIPVLTFSQNLNIDNYKMSLLEYKPEKNAPKKPLQVTKVGRAFIAAKANIRKHYKK